MKKVVTIIGTRPQLVKAAVVSSALRKKTKEVLVNTGQHYDHNMAGVFFEELGIPAPDYNLNIGSGTHGAQTGAMLTEVEKVLENEQPDGVLVYGDTNSTLAGTLAASKMHIPVFHVEAGLRSYNKEMPEEINRIMTDHVSTLLFAPTETAVINLKDEGISEGVIKTGDVMYDATLRFIQAAERDRSLESFGLTSDQFILATVHRAENTDRPERLAGLFHALNRAETKVVLPLHPRTRKKLQEANLFHLVEHSPTIQLLDPLSYLDMLLLEKHARYIVTDSGGVQKEAYFAQTPCLTVRDETEWGETITAGWNRLVSPIGLDLEAERRQLHPLEGTTTLYGDGHASEHIADHIASELQKEEVGTWAAHS
ncbi:non-hydrolyzing UDP-N-acetylglucosamine 2-epimerase [Aureibacillus halotolerans]|uniref:UDP-N-acetylglucosamine 2-epimerase (Non-hydrolysing)/UDP-GlcNAc3NAcA epimerase n=1 Tax=Aureibacillus halotolerans TaxID=1508390 RepID=A0A4R6TYK9_9BACI|nr:UDP-N-acetylglucosamine 2-epimerase (non-hydrolyzing) [Aureibacillus halotolerans]TDQ38671.1 UDP-N-acetylglucosamine 2-epimerase (non-hydrolysing)/UDP-GlcNAc3NAcA epimerase [Aureibacillus halotolerans]